MTYNAVKHLKPTEFKRLCGVRPETFDSMLTVLRQADTQKLPGRPSKLSLEDQLLMTLENGARVSYILSYWTILGSE